MSAREPTRFINDDYPFDLGTYSRTVTTCNDDNNDDHDNHTAQIWFDRG